jgi:hypothetical protein
MFSTRSQRIVASAAAAVGITLGAAGISAAASTPATPARPAVHNVAPSEADAGKPDTDNVQEGDQTSPDAPAALKSKTAEPKETGDKEADSGKPDTDNVQAGPGDTTDGGGADTAGQ